MTGNGDQYSTGTVFKIEYSGTGFDTLTSFASSAIYGGNGAYPYGSLLLTN